MVLAYLAGLLLLILDGSAETASAFALVLGLLLAYYGYLWFVRDRRS